MTKSPIKQSAGSDSATVFWASVALAIGSAGVVITSVFYALSPAPAALPIPNPSFAIAFEGMRAGRATMIAAGTIGVLADVILAAGTLQLMTFRKPASLPIERAGWAFVTISVLIFVGVDSLAASVLPNIAALEGVTAAFAGFKLLFDVLFILGTIAFGIGVPMIFVSEMKSESPVLATPLIWIGMCTALVGLVSGFLYFLSISLPQLIGISIAGGALVFAIYGIQIAGSVRQSSPEW